MLRATLLLFLLLAGTIARADDRGYVQAFLEDNLSSAGRTVKIEGFKGALSSQASFDLLTIADDQGVWLTIRNAVLDWSRSALLTGKLEVNELSAGEIDLVRIPAVPSSGPSAASSPFSLPDLPVSIDIAKLSVKKLGLGAAVLGRAATFSLGGEAHLSGGQGNAKFSMTRTDGPKAAFGVEGSFSNTTRKLNLSLDLSEAADGIVGNLIGLPGTPAFDLTLKGQGPLGDFHSDLTLATDGQPRVTGSFTMKDMPDPQSPDTSIRAFTARLGGDLRPLVAAQYHPFLGPKLDLSLQGERFTDGRTVISDLALSTEAMRLGGNFATDASGWPVSANLAGDITPAGGEAAVTLLLPGQQTQVQGGTIKLGYDAARGNRWTLTAALDGFSRPQIGIGQVRIDGSGTLDPQMKTFSGKVAARASGVAPQDDALATAIGSNVSLSTGFDYVSGKPLVLTGLDLTGDGYGMTGDLTVAGVDGAVDLAIDGKLSVQADDLSRYAALAGQPLGGSGTLAIEGKVLPLSGAFDLTVRGRTQDLKTGVAELDPLLAGTATLNAAASRGDYGVRLKSLSVDGQGVALTASGLLSSSGASALDAKLALDDLGKIAKGATGPVKIAVTAKEGEGGTWTGQATAQGPGQAEVGFDGSAVLGDNGLENVSGKLSLKASDLSPYASLAGRDLGGALDAVVLGQGDVAARTFSVSIKGTSQDLRTGVAEADKALAGKSTFHIAARRDGQGRIGIETLDVKTPHVQASASGDVEPGKGQLDFKVGVSDVGRFVEGFSGAANAEGSVSVGKTGDWGVKASLGAAGGATADVSGTIASDGSRAKLTARGTAPLGYVNRFISPNRTEGTARFDLGFDGPLALESLSGEVTLQDVRLSAPTARLGIEGMGGTIRVLQGGTARLDLTGRATGGGTVTVSGTTGIVAPYKADLSFGMKDVAVAEPGLYQTTVSGKAGLAGELTGVAKATGAFTLGQTEIRLSEIPSGSAGAVDGLTHVNESAASRETRARAGLIAKPASSSSSAAWPLDITVDAPNRIFVRGRGLDAELGGRLSLTGTTAAVVTQGRFTLIRGRLDFLGKRLTLNDATIRLQGDFNPYIDATAVTQSGDTQITVHLSGPASQPVIDFTSSPDLPQDEIVSRLLFDKGIAEVSALQALKIASALRTLAGGGGSFTDTLRSKTGLDNLDVTSTASGETEVTAGKYIGRNLYSDVTVDSAGKSSVDLNLKLTPSITTRGTFTSDGNSSVGVFFEKDY